MAVLAGNAIYFPLMPHLPPGVRHVPYRVDAGLGLDGLICLVLYGVISLLERRRSEGAGKSGRR